MLPKFAIIIASYLANVAPAYPASRAVNEIEYPSCGGLTDKPHECNTQSVCMDDPREPNSCGMACDVPGICIPRNAATCQTGTETCPQGQKCFGDLRFKCKGNNCHGLCLYPKGDGSV